MKESRFGAELGALYLALHQVVSGSIPRLRVISRLSLLVLCSALGGFFPRYSVFPLSSKTKLG